ncbi:MAG: hypothetical protein ACHQZR_03045 [Candidatus Limnocylindrales bacterium]
MPDGLDAILRLVADGRLSADEAAPLVEALLTAGETSGTPDKAGGPTADRGVPPDHVRLTVTEGGRTVVNLRVPVALGRVAVGLVPGLSIGDSSRLEAAVAAGRMGPLLDISDEDGDGVRVVLE